MKFMKPSKMLINFRENIYIYIKSMIKDIQQDTTSDTKWNFILLFEYGAWRASSDHFGHKKKTSKKHALKNLFASKSFINFESFRIVFTHDIFIIFILCVAELRFSLMWYRTFYIKITTTCFLFATVLADILPRRPLKRDAK